METSLSSSPGRRAQRRGGLPGRVFCDGASALCDGAAGAELTTPDTAGLGDLPGVGQRLRRAVALTPDLKILVAHGYFDLATPYFRLQVRAGALELDEDTFPNLQLSVYPGGHMFYTRVDARKQFHADAKVLYQASRRGPQRRAGGPGLQPIWPERVLSGILRSPRLSAGDRLPQWAGRGRGP